MLSADFRLTFLLALVMDSRRYAAAFLLLFAMSFTPSNAGAQESSPKPTDDRIDVLIRQLGADRLADREAATRALIDVGKPALGALDVARKDADTEIARRVSFHSYC